MVNRGWSLADDSLTREQEEGTDDIRAGQCPKRKRADLSADPSGESPDVGTYGTSLLTS